MMPAAVSNLWQASFRGVPFYMEEEDEEFGRRLFQHLFPGRDAPFIEDQGAQPKMWRLTAYIAGDSANASASAAVAALTAKGPGTLVLSGQGPVSARLHIGSRAASKDRYGLVAFRLEFWASGSSGVFASIDNLAQLVYSSIGNMPAALSSAASALNLSGAAWTVSSAVGALQNVPATLEAIRAESPVSAAASAAISAGLSAAYNAIPSAFPVSR